MCVFYLFADLDRTTVFSIFTFGDSVKLLRLLSIRFMQHGSHSHGPHSHSPHTHTGNHGSHNHGPTAHNHGPHSHVHTIHAYFVLGLITCFKC